MMAPCTTCGRRFHSKGFTANMAKPFNPEKDCTCFDLTHVRVNNINPAVLLVEWTGPDTLLGMQVFDGTVIESGHDYVVLEGEKALVERAAVEWLLCDDESGERAAVVFFTEGSVWGRPDMDRMHQVLLSRHLIDKIGWEGLLGWRVLESNEGTAGRGIPGTLRKSDHDDYLIAMWDNRMGTAITHGTVIDFTHPRNETALLGLLNTAVQERWGVTGEVEVAYRQEGNVLVTLSVPDQMHAAIGAECLGSALAHTLLEVLG